MASEHEHDTHYRIEHDPTPDQSTAVEAGAKRSPSLLDAPATYGLLFLNLLWFAAMLRSGPYIADWHMHRFGSLLTDSFSIEALSFFGGCDASLVLVHGQWIRVVTAAFIHMNPLHLLVNMWCLWNLGLLGEPLLGRRGLVAVYLLTGISGNLCSLAFDVFMRHDALVVGASGAVFGIAGILIVLLSNRKLSLPWNELRGLRRSVVQFAVLNLLIGIVPQVLMPAIPKAFNHLAVDLSPLAHIDNMAHLGGLACGLLMGLPLFPRMLVGRAGYRERQRITFAGTAFLLTLFAYSIVNFRGKP
ncbi:MAG: rhomboid family intramembrane serine protease [Acidobacteriaceae bacterium]